MEPTDLTIPSVRNFRDFGGHATGDGRRVVTGQLFRSAHYNNVTPEDAAKLYALGAKFLVDLRHADERGRAPNLWAPARVLTQGDGGEHVAAVEVGARNAAARGRMSMIEAYRYIPYGRRFTALFGEFFRTLADEGGPVIIHCAIGKDRTGILSALLLTALGVDRETIFADYLSSNDRIEAAREGATDNVFEMLNDETAARRVGVTADYLQASFDVIEEKSGGVDAYFRDLLDVAPAHIARLRERFVF